jgi:hypothetical protein
VCDSVLEIFINLKPVSTGSLINHVSVLVDVQRQYDVYTGKKLKGQGGHSVDKSQSGGQLANIFRLSDLAASLALLAGVDEFITKRSRNSMANLALLEKLARNRHRLGYRIR